MIRECYTEEFLAAYAAGACPRGDADAIESHVRICASCRAWLEEAASNDAIAGSVVGALEAYAGEGPRLDRPDDPAHDGALIGQRVGQFHVERVIARGGMGTVYLAAQERPRRPVALKVMRAGLLSRSARRRFDSESQVLARLQHPNIAQVYEAGVAEVSFDTESGRHRQVRSPQATLVPYFAMEYVPNARTITDYASANGLTIRQRLELFVQVCDAVHHGHQRGVIHRDLKPANILVASGDEAGTKGLRDPGTEGNSDAKSSPSVPRSLVSSFPSSAAPKVIDFGVARSIDSDLAATMHTHTGQLVGTLAYMSPEQCRANPNDIDTRSDVYSLGVVLYELLCERMPYEVSRTNVVAAGRTICEQPALRPSAALRMVRGDPERIVLKALEKDRTRRYASADALAQDIRRYLSGEPAQARPATAWIHAIRWSLRHPKITTAAACLMIATGILIVSPRLAARIAWTLPHRLQASSDYSEIRLHAFDGREIAAWHTGWASPNGASPLSRLLDQPASMGARRLAIIGYGQSADPKYAGGLCAYDVDRNPQSAYWIRRVSVKELPSSRPVEKYWGNQRVEHWDAFDVFPEEQSRGKEIAASFCVGPRSPRCIRMYDLEGKLLYQVWHDGVIADFQWLSGPGLLVCIGDNKAAKWQGREVDVDINEQAGPNVIFAIRPQFGLIAREFLDSEHPGEGDDLRPIWYQCLHPLKEGSERASWCGINPVGPAEAELCVRIRGDDGTFGDFNFKIDESGEEVPASRVAADSYSNLSAAPSIDVFRLDSLPRIRGSAKSE